MQPVCRRHARDEREKCTLRTTRIKHSPHASPWPNKAEARKGSRGLYFGAGIVAGCGGYQVNQAAVTRVILRSEICGFGDELSPRASYVLYKVQSIHATTHCSCRQYSVVTQCEDTCEDNYPMFRGSMSKARLTLREAKHKALPGHHPGRIAPGD